MKNVLSIKLFMLWIKIFKKTSQTYVFTIQHTKYFTTIIVMLHFNEHQTFPFDSYQVIQDLLNLLFVISAVKNLLFPSFIRSKLRLLNYFSFHLLISWMIHFAFEPEWKPKYFARLILCGCILHFAFYNLILCDLLLHFAFYDLILCYILHFAFYNLILCC